MSKSLHQSIGRLPVTLGAMFLGSVMLPAFGQEVAWENPASAPTIHHAWPFNSDEAKTRQQHAASEIGKPVEVANSQPMKLVLIPAGEFVMGAAEGDREAEADERPAHRVRITKPFYLGKYEVARGQFRKFVDATDYKTDAERDGRGGWGYTKDDARPFARDPKFTWREVGFDQDDHHPVVNVSWNDAVAYCKWLSDLEQEKYRLPTEAEWEYACRAGTSTPWHHGSDPHGVVQIGNVSDQAFVAKFAEWMKASEVDRAKMASSSPEDGYIFTAPVGRFAPNAFGLYDMQGNVWEWCADWDHPRYYTDSPLDDPAGPFDGKARIRRGGSWLHAPSFSRSSQRRRYAPDARNSPIGFRVVKEVDTRQE